MHFQAAWEFGPDTRWLIIPPLFHAAGSIAVLAMIWHAGRQVVLSAFDPGAALDLIESERITATLVVPTMLAAICDEQLARPRDASSLALTEPRRRPGRHRNAAARAHEGVRRCAADARCYGSHRDRADRDDPPP